MRIAKAGLATLALALVAACGGGSDNAPAAPAAGGGGAPVSSALVASYDLVFRGTCGSQCSYVDGKQYKFEITADGRLVTPEGEFTAPFERNGNEAELIWADTPNKLEYAVSDNTRSFNEINLGDAGKPGALGIPAFLGQFSKR